MAGRGGQKGNIHVETERLAGSQGKYHKHNNPQLPGRERRRYLFATAKFHTAAGAAMYYWAQGHSWNSVIKATGIAEGDMATLVLVGRPRRLLPVSLALLLATGLTGFTGLAGGTDLTVVTRLLAGAVGAALATLGLDGRPRRLLLAAR